MKARNIYPTTAMLYVRCKPQKNYEQVAHDMSVEEEEEEMGQEGQMMVGKREPQ